MTELNERLSAGPAGAVLANTGAGSREVLTWARIGRRLQPLFVPAVILIGWELAVRSGAVPSGLLSSPAGIATGLWFWAFGTAGSGMNAYSGTLIANIFNSGERVAEGYALAICLGVPGGLMIGFNRGFARTLDPLIQAMRPIPITAWMPVSLTLFGVGAASAISLIALGAFYPIVVNSVMGARDINRQLVRAALMMGATPRQIMLRVIVPSALPAIFVGLRLGAGVAWTAVVIAEMVAVKSGLGYVLWDAYYIGRMEIVLGDMAVIGLLGFLSDRLILAVERRVLHWKNDNSR
ncbi:MAG: ABC transporter permease [Xanthobacteraceae bacterium]|nr:ABC transporter permease [Xanthobacteraceae bacterium]